MLTRLNRQLSYCLAVLLGVAIGSVGPGVAQAAYDAVNAHKVDGFHAVGAGASASTRAGKLVAANSKGRAPDAERLNGLTHSKLRHLPVQIQSVGTESGGSVNSFAAFLAGAGSSVLTVSFLVPPDHTPGTPVYMDVLYEVPPAGGCTFYVYADGLAGGAGSPIANALAWRLPGDTDHHGPVAVPAGFNQGHKVTFRYAAATAPGRLISFRLTRDAENGADNCGQVAIYGLQLRY